MIYSVEGVPMKEKLTLPTGEEIEINLAAAGASGDGEDGQMGGEDADVRMPRNISG